MNERGYCELGPFLYVFQKIQMNDLFCFVHWTEFI